MNINRPDAAERDERGQRFEREAENERGQVDDADRVDRVERMFAMGGEPIEMLGTVMNRVESPQETDPVLQAMRPVNG